MKSFVCELGFSYAKWLFEEKKGKVLSVFMQNAGGVPLIGKQALDRPGGVSYILNSEEMVNCYPWFLEKCLDDAGVEKDEHVRVAVGLPVEYWEQQGEIEEGAIDKLSKSLLSNRVKEVVVMPQGLGGVRDFLSTLKKMPDGYILGVDIGFNTVIYTIYDPTSQEMIANHTMWKRGVNQMVDQFLMPLIKQKISGKNITPPEVAFMMERGYYTDGFDKVDLKKQIKEASNSYRDNILKEILALVKDSISITNPLAQVIFFGGGSTYLDDMSNYTVDVKVLPEPEFANARGFMRFLED